MCHVKINTLYLKMLFYMHFETLSILSFHDYIKIKYLVVKTEFTTSYFIT